MKQKNRERVVYQLWANVEAINTLVFMKQIKKFTKEYILGHVLGNEIVHKDQVTETNNSNDRQNIGVQKKEYFRSFCS